ncbi:50S ribosomal protein L10 [Candidatus Cyrtobacter comes]|uniref:Large ribosomal subunit protein uL10 n=1 Tax=Candidatus Cyrtobacter comes TaxID=675776 RepID=A0ABU5L7P2_9RICK|nr:50S ribosomal protein L10 [Candidatus Cyrtobacter comes]MDZ5761829.1 50S ribosomal protein L10 [Candidatus Cyrtobacter comes]
MSKASNQEVVRSLSDLFSSVPVVFILRPGALNAAQIRGIRRQLQSVGGFYRIAKNTLAKVALKDTSYESFLNVLKGPTALVYGEDILSILSVLSKAQKEFSGKLEILSCSMGSDNLDNVELESLARFSSVSHLRSELLARMSAVPSAFVRLLGVYSSSLS